MSYYTPKVGDRVRVVLEGPVTDVFSVSRCIQINTGDGYHTRFPLDRASVEKLPDPEPEWIAGDIVVDAIGRIFEASGFSVGGTGGKSWWTRKGDRRVPFDHPTRPLTLIVHRGKPVVCDRRQAHPLSRGVRGTPPRGAAEADRERP